MALTVMPAGAQPSVPDAPTDASSVAGVAVSGAAAVVGSAPVSSTVQNAQPPYGQVASEAGKTTRFTVAESTDAIVTVAKETNKTVRGLND
jgi:hypothetical protein